MSVGEGLQWLLVQQAAWIVGAISLTMTWLMGSKVWWAPLLGLVGQVFWGILAVNTQQWGLLVTVALYTVVHARNAHRWWWLHRHGGMA